MVLYDEDEHSVIPRCTWFDGMIVGLTQDDAFLCSVTAVCRPGFSQSRGEMHHHDSREHLAIRHPNVRLCSLGLMPM